MSSYRRECCICTAEADWVCVRTPNQGHLDYLCDRHFQSLREHNPILADRYDHVAAIAPMGMDTDRATSENIRRR